jgi:predicted RNA methylase
MDAGVGYWEGRVSKLSKARKGEILNRITETVEPEKAKVIVDDLIDKKLINKTTVKISKIMKDIENSELFPQLSRSAKEKIIYDRTSRVKNVK